MGEKITDVRNGYRFSANKGELVITLVSECMRTCFGLFTKDGDEIAISESSYSGASFTDRSGQNGAGKSNVYWSETTKTAKATLTYNVPKGDYVFVVYQGWESELGNNKYTVKVETEASRKNEPSAAYITIPMLVGDTLQLSSMVTPSGTTADKSWKTSKKSVATVSSKGKVTAKAKGTAIITLTVGSIETKIAVSVKNPNVDKNAVTFRDKDGNIILDLSDIKTAKVQSSGLGYDVLITLTSSGKTKFAEATKKLIGEKISFYVGEELVLAPTVSAAIVDGSVLMSIGVAKDEAERIVKMISDNVN